MTQRLPHWQGKIVLSVLLGLLALLLSACQPLAGTQAPTVPVVPAATLTPLPGVATSVSPTSLPATAPAETPIATPDLNRVLADTLRNLPEGRMAFNPPAEMRAGEWARVALRIQPLGPGLEATQVEATLVARLPGEAEPTVEPLKVGTIMKARLEGDSFQVSAHNTEEQIVSSDAFTEWVWDIKALKSGAQKLDLVVSVRVLVEGWGERQRDLPVMTKEIVVKVNPVYSLMTFVGKYWQWLATTLLIPLGGWAWKAVKGRRGDKETRRRGDKETRRRGGTGTR